MAADTKANHNQFYANYPF